MAMKIAWTTQDIGNLAGRRAIITGSNSGIGFPAALELARHGAEVVLAVRDPKRGAAARERILNEVAGANVSVGQLDLASLASVREFCAYQTGLGLPVDLLINNAGVMGFTKRLESPDGFELQFATNVLGHFALTGLLLPLLESAGRLADKARVVWVASIAHKRGKINFDDLQSQKHYVPMGAYSQTKLADLMLAFEMDRRLKAAAAGSGAAGVMSLACHPGVANTEIFKQGNHPAFEKAMRSFVGGVIGAVLNTDAEGALPTLFAAAAPTAESGAYYGPQGFLEARKGDVGPATVMPKARDQAVAKRLWETCEQLTGVRFLD